jgi:hypothetical protein
VAALLSHSVLEICDKLLYSFGADMLEGAPTMDASSSL